MSRLISSGERPAEYNLLHVVAGLDGPTNPQHGATTATSNSSNNNNGTITDAGGSAGAGAAGDGGGGGGADGGGGYGDDSGGGGDGDGASKGPAVETRSYALTRWIIEFVVDRLAKRYAAPPPPTT